MENNEIEEFSIGNMAPVVPITGDVLSKNGVAKPAKLDNTIESDDEDNNKIKDDIITEFDALDMMVPGTGVTEEAVHIEKNDKIAYLIKCASKKKFTNSDCKKWSQGIDNSDKMYDKLLQMDLGYAWSDDCGNYIVYSFKNEAFYYFDHENIEVINKRITKANAIKTIEEWDTWDGNKYKKGKHVEESMEDTILVIDDEDTLFTEESDKEIDEDIKPIIDELNKKGFKTKYSCSGHPSARVKNDRFRDGVLNGKLYSTARIVFDGHYNITAPSNWEYRDLNGGKDSAIYVKQPTFKILNGLPKEAFYKWKQKYMNSLTKWVEDLSKDSIDKNEEKLKELTESVLNDVLIDAL